MSDAQTWTLIGGFFAFLAGYTTMMLALLRTEGRRVDARFDAVGYRFDALEHRFDALEHRFDAMEQRFDAMEKRLDAKIDKLDADISAIIRKLLG